MYNDNNWMNNSYESNAGNLPTTANSFESFGGNSMPGYTSVPSPASSSGKESKTPLLILIGVIVVMVCAFGVAGLIFLNQPKTKIARAIAKTAADGGYLSEDTKSKLVLTNTMTYKMNLACKQGMDETRVEMDLAFDGLHKQISGKANVPYIGGFDFVSDLNENDFRFKIPQLDDHVFVYNYHNAKSGFISQALGSSGVEEMDTSLARLYNSTIKGSGGKQESDLQKATKEFYNRIVFNKAGSKEFMVDGSSCSCAGYELVISKESLNRYIYDLEKYYTGNSSGSTDDLLSGNYSEYVDMLKKLKQDIEEMGDVSVYVYLHKGELAAIQMPLPGHEGGTLEIDLMGGDYRLQNVVITSDYDGSNTELVHLAGSRSGETENWNLSLLGEEVFNASYEHPSQKYEININYDDIDWFVDGSFRTSKEENAFFANITDNKNELTLNMKIYFNRGATMKSISGTEFDLGNATISDISRLKLFSNLYKYMY